MCNHKKRNHQSIILILALLLAIGFAQAELVAVNEGGFHPEMHKQTISFTSTTNTETFDVRNAANDTIIYSGNLAKARDIDGNIVNCQGNNPCLIGDFSNFKTPGTYYTTTSLGGESKEFTINEDYANDYIIVFKSFFDALKQHNSSYHADLHTGYEVDFFAMADGSYIMEADQASKSLIRLASAYNRNPELIQPFREDIIAYTNYLITLQGRTITEDENGPVRLDSTFVTTGAFTPGTPAQSTVDIYLENGNFVETIPITSLCNAKTGDEYDTCIDFAADYYKCQEQEICLNRTYIGKRGYINDEPEGLGISKGWGYEFGCYHDFDLEAGTFQNEYDPCMIFYPQEERKYTAEFLYALLAAVPAAYDTNPELAAEYVQRAVNTRSYFLNAYEPVANGEEDAAWYGAALFSLYDYTGNNTFLEEAHSLRPLISTQLISDNTRGPEYYWSEYSTHKQDIIDAELTYGAEPAELFRGKMFFDWKDRGPLRISNNAERIYQFDNNIQFQNSRFMLTEAVIAAKTLDLSTQAPSWTDEIADQQLAWLSGQNGVQLGVGQNAPITALSFIFGIGTFPQEQHSRLYMNSGYFEQTNGAIVGARGTGLKYDNGTTLVSLDGTTDIMGTRFGSFGNGEDNETQTSRWNLEQTFSNGENYIPGWINGAFDVFSDQDIIFNYRDSVGTYENTETTNEIIATAIELLAIRDAQLNGALPHEPLPTIYSSEVENGRLIVNVSPDNASVLVTNSNGEEVVESIGNLNTTLTPSNYNVQIQYGNESTNETITIYPGQTTRVILAIQLPTPIPACVATVFGAPASCDAAITTDTVEGTCRRIICQSAQGSVSVLACNKPNSENAQYFEMYRQEASGQIPQLCLDETCVQHNGYARSENFDMCNVNQTPTGNVTTLTLYDPAGTLANKILIGGETINLSRYQQGIGLRAASEGEVTSVSFEVTRSGITTDSSAPFERELTPQTGNQIITLTPSGLSGEGTKEFYSLTFIKDAPTGNETACYELVQDIPVQCINSEKTQDSSIGCRHVTCTGATGSVSVLACNKPNNENPTHFELYKQSSSGYGVDVCFGELCLEGWGFKQSEPFPICTGEPPAPQTGSITSLILFDPTGNRADMTVSGEITINANNYPAGIGIRAETSGDIEYIETRTNSSDPPSGEIIQQLPNPPYELTLPSEEQTITYSAAPFGPSGEGEAQELLITITEEQINATVELTLAPWYPQGTHTVLKCNAEGISPTSYLWTFGDGMSQTSSRNDVYHIYPESGTYDATCTVNVDGNTFSDSLSIEIAG